jgi:hypothetical protein
MPKLRMYGTLPPIPYVFTAWCFVNTLNAKLNPICHLLALLGAQTIIHVSRIGVKEMEKFNGNFAVKLPRGCILKLCATKPDGDLFGESKSSHL